MLESGQGRDRTGDTCIFSAVLYQLSYLTDLLVHRERLASTVRILETDSGDCQSVHKETLGNPPSAACGIAADKEIAGKSPLISRRSLRSLAARPTDNVAERTIGRSPAGAAEPFVQR